MGLRRGLRRRAAQRRFGIDIFAVVLVLSIPVFMVVFGRAGGFIPLVLLTFLFIVAEAAGWRRDQRDRTDRRRRRRARRRDPPRRPPPPPMAAGRFAHRVRHLGARRTRIRTPGNHGTDSGNVVLIAFGVAAALFVIWVRWIQPLL